MGASYTIIHQIAANRKEIHRGTKQEFECLTARSMRLNSIAGLKERAEEIDIQIAAEDSREVRELKQIVNGMREEMRGYLANGNGTPRSYWRRLNERTLSEMQIYERTRRELEKETRPEIWEQKNESLRILGLRTIPVPNE